MVLPLACDIFPRLHYTLYMHVTIATMRMRHVLRQSAPPTKLIWLVSGGLFEDMVWRFISKTRTFEVPFWVGLSLVLWCSARNEASRGTTGAVISSHPPSPSIPLVNATAVEIPSLTITSFSIPRPTPTPHLCATGLERGIAPDGSIFLLGTVYFDLSEPIPCSGIIVGWHYCHYVIGFRGIPASVWPCVWRRVNDTGYSRVGLNRITITPAIGDNQKYHCGNYTPKPEELIQVEIGDVIGFYAPEKGLFIAAASSSEDSYFQFQRAEPGFVQFVNDSDFVQVGNTSGRALLGATIGK